MKHPKYRNESKAINEKETERKKNENELMPSTFVGRITVKKETILAKRKKILARGCHIHITEMDHWTFNGKFNLTVHLEI